VLFLQYLFAWLVLEISLIKGHILATYGKRFIWRSSWHRIEWFPNGFPSIQLENLHSISANTITKSSKSKVLCLLHFPSVCPAIITPCCCLLFAQLIAEWEAKTQTIAQRQESMLPNSRDIVGRSGRYGYTDTTDGCGTDGRLTRGEIMNV